jgi:chromosome segregation protein
MRFAELNLLAYGKFTEHKLLFPKSDHDFHVIVGPNEAGKSTVRRAITELLFGMEVRSPLGFKHAQSDLRVAGVLESAAAKLAFMRTKQQKSLRSMSDEVLQESYLTPLLGALSQEAFEELHCLDHARLLKGGQGIVDPKNTVSQILFQAASGLEDFTAIREALGLRASELFAKGGRNNQFTRSAEKFSVAQRTLRDVQVRTKAWVEARDALEAASQALENERKNRRDLDLQRTSWDRARRLAPLVEKLTKLQQELIELGEVTTFPPHADEVLANGIEQMNAASAKLQTRTEDVTRAQAELDAFEVEEAILKEASAIASLGSLCGLHPNHARDLPLRRAEVVGWLKEILERSAQFGWGQTEEEVRALIPQDKVVRAIDALLKSRGALLAEERAAKQTQEERQTAVDDLKEKLEAAVDQALDPRLTQALELALPFKNSDARQQTLLAAATTAQAAARKALAALGRPELTEELLRTMQVPSLERVNTYRGNREKLVQAADLSRSLGEKSKATASELELKRSQFARSHQVVTFTEVSDARRDRDNQWAAIKTHGAVLPEAAPRMDVAIRLADELGDSRTRSETDAAEAQSLREQHEKATQEQELHEAAVAQKERELEEFDAKWSEMAAAVGLASMDLDDVPDWLAKRAAALQAADLAGQRRQEYEFERDQAAQGKQALVAAMTTAGVEASESAGLALLCASVDEHVKKVTLSRTRRQDITQRLELAESALRVASKSKDSKTSEVTKWETSWQDALTKANLAGVSGDVAEVESAMLAVGFIQQRLARVDTTRSERIDAMEADLTRMEEAADALVKLMAPELADAAPEEVFAGLSSRLEDAKRESDRKAQAQKYLDEAKRQRDDANSELLEARRGLKPLLKTAGVEDPMLALPMVERWQAKTELQSGIAQTLRELELGSDSLSLEAVQAEVASHPAAEAEEQVLRLRDELADSESTVTTLVTRQVTAKQVFEEIAGGDKAAVAEAQKHEALAEMSEVSEEYLQLATAGSLLKWAVDRYRDRKQGPLLQRASVIFKSLTRGSFEKLRVDFDQSTPALVAYRPNNQAVRVAGLSDGTRDQLFLALRIAALELQADQGSPMPFIADDLFINFDDKRSQAGLKALYEMSSRTQVLFLSHQEHLVPVIQSLFPGVNLITLQAEELTA